MSSGDPNHNPNPKPKPFSISLSSTSQNKKLSPSSSTRPTKSTNGPSSKPTAESLPRRPRTFQDHDSDNEDGNHQGPVVEEVTGFDREAGGAISAHRRAEQEKKPLVIKVESKNNWQERPWQRKRKGLNLLPAEVRAQREAEARGIAPADATREVEGPSMKFGLSLAEKSEGEGGDGDVRMADDGSVEKEKEKEREDKQPDGEEEIPQKPLTQDEIAMQALIRESKGDGGEPTRRSDLVISGKRKERDEDEYGYGAEEERFDETKSFRADVASRPEPASLAAYSAIPVEEFGAALLRGMGWKDGEPIGRGKYGNSNARATKAPITERRPGYLGIGAKELPGNDKSGNSSEVELGAWGKSAMRKAKKPGEGLYTPVLMRNKKTGEMVTQEEFNRLVKEGGSEGAKKGGEDSWRERRDKNLQLHGRDKGRDRDRDRRSERDNDGSSESDDRYKSRRNGSGTSDKDGARDRRKRYKDREADTVDSGLDDRYHRDRRSDHNDRDRASGRDRDRERDRKYSGSRKSYDDDNDDDGDYRSRPSSSASRRDRSAGRDSRRDKDRASTRDRRDRNDKDRDDSRKSRSRREEVY
ncbi:hypothetical protein EMPG_16583 [Blastomyces silverae]|uniref:Pre-mRNA-splicing factor n=1 Tax=Blastomyces silverae TaxID=2060906 RepID=A0A0H1BA28_9EURO|nr:hypothetical protein EMPG_16583 [Blastomyces silverae]